MSLNGSSSSVGAGSGCGSGIVTSGFTGFTIVAVVFALPRVDD